MKSKLISTCFPSYVTIRIQGVHGQGKSQGKMFFQGQEIVRKFDNSQGISHFQPKVREKSGNFENNFLRIAKDIKNNG